MNKSSYNNKIITILGNWIKPADVIYHFKKKWLEAYVSESFNNNRVILDLGSGNRKLSSKIISLDIKKSEGVNIIADGSILPFKSEVFDLVISTAVLEHVQNLNSIVTEIRRCVKKDGLIYIEVPFLQTYHAHPNDYRRFTLNGLEMLWKGFEKIESGVCIGPFSVFAWYLRKLPRFIVGENIFGFVLEFIFSWLFFWIKYLDAIIPSAKKAHQMACGLFFLGKKR